MIYCVVGMSGDWIVLWLECLKLESLVVDKQIYTYFNLSIIDVMLVFLKIKGGLNEQIQYFCSLYIQ